MRGVMKKDHYRVSDAEVLDGHRSPARSPSWVIRPAVLGASSRLEDLRDLERLVSERVRDAAGEVFGDSRPGRSVLRLKIPRIVR